MFDNLSKREKTMAMIVGCLLPLVIVFFAYTSITESLRQKNSQIVGLTERVGELQLQKVKGELAAKRLAMYRELSLPANTEKSVTQYQLWLQELVEKTGIEGFTVNVKNRNAPETIIGYQNRPASRIYKVEISKGIGTVRQFVELLYQLQQAKLLQRINEFVVRPIIAGSGASAKPTGKIMIDRITIEVVVVSNADEARGFEQEVHAESKRTLDEYLKTIASRDVFGLPNEEPSLGVDTSQEFELGRNVRIDLEGRDENEGQKLTYQISDLKWDLDDQTAVFDESQVNLEDGEVEFGRLPKGEYSFLARVTDDGWPNKSDEKRVRIEVFEEEVAPPDPVRPEANDSYISGKTTKDGSISQIWIRINPQDKLLMLTEGESFELDEKKWTISKIEEDSVLIDRDGTELRFRIGRSLDKPEEAAQPAETPLAKDESSGRS